MARAMFWTHPMLDGDCPGVVVSASPADGENPARMRSLSATVVLGSEFQFELFSLKNVFELNTLHARLSVLE